MASTSLSQICIYSEPRSKVTDYDEIASYISSLLPDVRIKVQGPLLETKIMGAGPAGGAEVLARSLAQAKVRNPNGPVPEGQKVLPGEINYELGRLTDLESTVFGLLYDAGLLARIYRRALPAQESRLDNLTVIFTNQLIGTWDYSDRRYHARSVLCGSPSIISLSGIVEAPAKAQSYYLAKRGAEAIGLSEEERLKLATSFADDHIVHEDDRMTEVAKGYVMQAVAYRITGEPFCDDPSCRLFNAHWQSELLRAQLGGGREFCSKHEDALFTMKGE